MAQDSDVERKILATMRGVLSSIIKDTTPAHRSMAHPLSDATIQDVRQCLGLISLRERELAKAAGITEERPHFTDEKRDAEIIPISSIKRIDKD